MWLIIYEVSELAVQVLTGLFWLLCWPPMFIQRMLIRFGRVEDAD